MYELRGEFHRVVSPTRNDSVKCIIRRAVCTFMRFSSVTVYKDYFVVKTFEPISRRASFMISSRYILNNPARSRDRIHARY